MLIPSVDGRTPDNVTASRILGYGMRSDPVKAFLVVVFVQGLFRFPESGEGWSPGLRPRPVATSGFDLSSSKMDWSPLRRLRYGCILVAQYWWMAETEPFDRPYPRVYCFPYVQSSNSIPASSSLGVSTSVLSDRKGLVLDASFAR